MTSVEYQIAGTSGLWTNCTATDGAFDEIGEAFTCDLGTEPEPGSYDVYLRVTDSNGNTAEILFFSFVVNGGLAETGENILIIQLLILPTLLCSLLVSLKKRLIYSIRIQ